MDLGFINTQTRHNTKEIGLMIYSKELGNKSGQMDHVIKVNIKMVSDMVLAYTKLQMAPFTKVNGNKGS